MTEEKLTPIQKLGKAQDRIKELEAQVIQAEDIAKEMMDEYELNKVAVAEHLKRIVELAEELEGVQIAYDATVGRLAIYHNMNFFQRLWWAFTKKV